MMILANRLAADYAAQNDLPIIYRVQSPPTEALPDVDPDDPFAFVKLKGRIKPATLSLHPAQHWGLGLDQYTQVTSPLRRYSDLVIQRQLHAALAGKSPPYSADQLLRVLATAEATEREIKRLEAAVDYRWALEYIARLESKTDLQGWVLEKAPSGGYRFELEACGAQGILQDKQARQTGDRVRVDVKTVNPRQGVLRLLASRSR
jgi:exoribonuclease-2